MTPHDEHRELFARRARQVVRLRKAAEREHLARVAAVRNKPIDPEEARFDREVSLPCDCGE